MTQNKDITAVYSFNLCPNKTNYSGFDDVESFLSFLYLSVYYSKQNFKKVVLYTTEEGKDLVNKYGIEFDEIDTSFEKWVNKIEYKFWSIIKIYACSKQSEPFVHIDNDAVLLKGLPDHLLKSDCGFQSIEPQCCFQWYSSALLALRFDTKKRKLKIKEYLKNCNYKNFDAYNCGIIYFKKINKKLFRNWWRMAVSCCWFFGKLDFEDNVAILLNFEQLLITKLCERFDLSVNFLEVKQKYENYIHLISGSKRNPKARKKIKNRMQKQFPEFYKKIYES